MAFALKTYLLIFLVGSIHSTEFHTVQLDVGHGVLEPVSVTYDPQTHVTIINHQGPEGHMLVVSDRITGELAIKDEESHTCLVGKATVDMLRHLDDISMALRTHAIVSIPNHTYTFIPSTGVNVGSIIRNICDGSTLNTGHFNEGSYATLTRKYSCWGLSFGRTCVGFGHGR